MRSTAELIPKDPRQAVSLVSYAPDRATRLPYEVGCIEPYSRLREQGVSAPDMQRMARRWALRYRPQRLWINLRAGLPCVLGWLFVQRGWPVSAVIGGVQLDRAPEDVQPILMELWHAVDERYELPDVYQRDEFITDMVPLVTLDHIMQSTVPIMGTAVVSSDQP